MDKLKNIIKGILPVVVFFMATQVGVAQEMVKASNDKVEVKEWQTAIAIDNTEKSLNWSKQTDGGIQMQLWYYTGDTTDDHEDETKYRPATEADACEGSSLVRCVIQAPEIAGFPDLDNATVLSNKP